MDTMVVMVLTQDHYPQHDNTRQLTADFIIEQHRNAGGMCANDGSDLPMYMFTEPLEVHRQEMQLHVSNASVFELNVPAICKEINSTQAR